MKTTIITTILSAIFFWAGYSGYFSRTIVNKIFPCVEHPETTSFPCNGIWDLWLMGLTGIVFVLCIMYFGFQTYRMVKASY